MKAKIRLAVIELLSRTLGIILIKVYPNKANELAKNGMTLVLKGKLNFTERLMRRALLNKVEKDKNHELLSKLHQNYWVKKGDEFFDSNDDSFHKNFLPDCSFIFNVLKDELEKNTLKLHTIVEIGTGNGKVLNYLSNEFPEVKSLIGIDLSPIQTEKNSLNFKNNNKLKFIASDGLDWVKNYGRSNTIFVTSRGVLEYFTENNLKNLLKEIKNLGTVVFVAIEPNDINHNFYKNPNSIPYGSERSFSHNYSKLFKEAGFALWHESDKIFSKHVKQKFIIAKG
ncbi:class I SAM-dependent methyltransferase [Seonamhaeicola algicola]|uniref:Class I SAM-dependent methyltransferase n=1 Tax=Seonamhaeicola algicola TaxID=1719036 RepID=A0A5C7AVR0_9FLAO|nr:class I SAM-dependent methyltransferase [Seonamhaeicola algicola]TXE12886.1 class I SAM-dependent methyltransferase [Seonamhaeicola algicola]